MSRLYPIWSIEDGLGESDHDGWQELTARRRHHRRRRTCATPAALEAHPRVIMRSRLTQTCR